MSDDKPIIVIKKKGGHGGHHGGAWKVAYADFVTAMMAFFMVMWLLNSAEVTVRKAVASYFRKPGIFENGSPYIFKTGKGSGIFSDSYQPPKPDDMFNKWQLRSRLPTLKEEIEQELNIRRRLKGLSEDKPDKIVDKAAALVAEAPEELGTSVVGIAARELEVKDADIAKLFLHQLTGHAADSEEAEADNQEIDPDMVPGKPTLMKIVEQVRQQIQMSPELQELLGKVDVKVDATGLEIEITDSEKKSMFARGSAKVLPEARSAFKKLASIIGPIPKSIEIIGHTDAKPFSNIPGGYTNWDLSTARANEARRLLTLNGLPVDKISGVIGRAATQLKDVKDPFNYSNRRISLRMEFGISKTINPIQDPEAFDKAEKELELASEAAREAQRNAEAEIAQEKGANGGLMNSLPTRQTYGPTSNIPEKSEPKGPSKPIHSMTTSELINYAESKRTEQLPPITPRQTTASTPGQQQSKPKYVQPQSGAYFPQDPVFGSDDLF